MNPDFVEMLSALSGAGAEYLVVGAHAMAVHGRPRATGDLDIWIRPSPENAERVWAALTARREVIEIEGLEIGVIGRQDLIRNKRAVGRPRDLADVEELKPGGE